MNTEHITLSSGEKIGLISNLSTMLTAGISILEAVDSLLEDSKGNQRKILEVMRENLIQGKHLHTSFAQFPRVFDNVTINIIKASEEAGTLDITLQDLKENIKKEIEFTDKVRAALVYPMVIMVVFTGVLLLILLFVVPRISSVFTRLRMTLPLPTRILIFASQTLLTYTIPTILFFLLGGIGLTILYKKNSRLLLSVLVSLPLISNLMKEIDLTRFTRSLSLLLTAGIPIIYALDLTQDVVLKKEIAKAIYHCKDLVLSGKRLSEGLKDNKKIIPSIMIKITEAGEKTGTLDRSMQEISEYLDYQVSKTLQTATTLLEPIMLVIVGIMVGAMMLAIIAPIYGLIGKVGSR